MIKLRNIVLIDNQISLDVFSFECYPPEEYKLTINLETRQFTTDSNNPNLSEINRIIYKFKQYIEQKKDIPSSDCIACF